MTSLRQSWAVAQQRALMQNPNDSVGIEDAYIYSGAKISPLSIKQLCDLGQVPAPELAPFDVGSGLVPPGGAYNYILYGGGENLQGVSVLITVTQDMVWKSSAPGPETGVDDTHFIPDPGFSIQLNAYSASGAANCAWQQYVVRLDNSELFAGVCNWTSTLDLAFPPDWVSLASMPSSGTVPVGTQILIELQNDESGNVIGAAYAATYVTAVGGSTPTLPSQAWQTLWLTQTPSAPAGAVSVPGATAASVAPIVAFELNIVGPGNGDLTVLSSGAGTILYQASTALTVLNRQPERTQYPMSTSYGTVRCTGEDANTHYDLMSTIPNTQFSQSFSVDPNQVVSRLSKRPGVVLPGPAGAAVSKAK